MSPYEKIEALYAKHPQEEPIGKYVEWHARHGFVFARPDFFAMGRPVIRSAPQEQIVDLTHLFPSEDCDCWFIHAAAGNMSRMWQIMPWPLGWMCWGRVCDPFSELRFVPTETLKRLCPPDIKNIPLLK